jgi:GTPase SAR1 family protein
LSTSSYSLTEFFIAVIIILFSQIEDAPMRLQLWDSKSIYKLQANISPRGCFHTHLCVLLFHTAAGQERFRSLTSNFFGRADGFVLTYDISNRPSFDHVIGWMRDIKTRAPPDCDICLCANKADLDNDRVVSTEEGQQLADEYGVQFFETSALTGQNVERMFTALATTIKRKRIDDFENQHHNHGGGASSVDQGSLAADSRGGTVHLTDGTHGTQKAQAGCCS